MQIKMWNNFLSIFLLLSLAFFHEAMIFIGNMIQADFTLQKSEEGGSSELGFRKLGAARWALKFQAHPLGEKEKGKEREHVNKRVGSDTRVSSIPIGGILRGKCGCKE